MDDIIHRYFAFCWCDCLSEADQFVVGGDHTFNFLVLGERQATDAVETLTQVGLDVLRFFGFRQDLQQFVIGKEVKSGTGMKISSFFETFFQIKSFENAVLWLKNQLIGFRW